MTANTQTGLTLYAMDGDFTEAGPADPVLGAVLRRARNHADLTLRDVERQVGIASAHLSQIERGGIRRPDAALLMELAHLYGLDFQLIAQWAGYLDEEAGRHASGELIGLVLRMFAGLDPGGQSAAISYLQELRLGHGRE